MLGEFISISLMCWCTAGVFAPYGRVSFLCVAKEKVPKERPPYRVGLWRLCALQLRAALRNSLSLRQSSLSSALNFQCSTTQKGMVDQNPGQHLPGNTRHKKYKHPNHANVIPAQAGIPDYAKLLFHPVIARNEVTRQSLSY